MKQFDFKRFILSPGLLLIAGFLGVAVSYLGGVYTLLFIFTGLFLVFMFLWPKIGIWAFPLVSFFSPFDPIQIGYSPEKILMIGVLAFWLIRRKHALVSKGSLFSPLIITSIIYMFLNIIGLFNSSNYFQVGFTTVISVFSKFFLVFLTVTLLPDYSDLNISLKSMGLLTFLAFGGMLIVIVLNGDMLLFRIRPDDSQVSGFFSNTIFANPNFASSYGIMLYPIMFFMGLAEKKKFWKIVFFFLSTLAVVGTLLTFSRSGLLGLIVVTFYLVWKLRLKRQTIFLVILVTVGIFLIATNLPYFTTNISRAINRQDTSTEVRVFLLRASWDSIQDNPVLGSGPGSYGLNLRKYMKNYILVTKSIAAHNDWTNLFVELGFLGGGAFILLLFHYLRLIYLTAIKVTRFSPLWFILQGLIGSLIAAGIDSLFHEVLIHNLFWYLVAMSLVVVNFVNSPVYRSKGVLKNVFVT